MGNGGTLHGAGGNGQGTEPPPGVDPKVWELMTAEERASVVAFVEHVKIKEEHND